MEMNEKTLDQNYIYRGKILDFHVDHAEQASGRRVTRECVDHNGGVSVAVLTEQNEIYLVRQFRYPYRETVLETPAGKLEKGEDPFEAAKREQREETGTIGKNYVDLGKMYPSPGYTNEVISLYACRVESCGAQDLDEGEVLEAEKIPLSDAVEMVLRGEIPDAKTQILILRADKLISTGQAGF
jgi:ADP-ribose pyrophosphatase